MSQFFSLPAVQVFLGTSPLLGSIIWGLLQNDRRLSRIETRLDKIEDKLNSLDVRLTRVETKIEGKQVVLT